MADEDSTARERIEADSLARALEGDGSVEDVPDDALAAAGLMRFSQNSSALSESSRQAIRDEILYAARAGQRPHRSPRLRRWLIPAGGIGAAVAAAAMAVMIALPNRPAFVQPTTLPLPTASLLRAQIGAAQGDHSAIATLSLEMQDYRGDVYAALSDNYSRHQ